jgi:hypothetical protein
MKERPILFSGEMVKAILDSRKTQTRRIVKFPKHVMETPGAICEDGGGNWVAWSPGGRADLAEFTKKAYPNGEGFPCKYGKSGDRLWVRETWKVCERNGNQYLEYRAGGFRQFPRGIGEQQVSLTFKPSIFLPRWASRLTLEITGVRVERLQEITEDDAEAEGVKPLLPVADIRYRPAFQNLWEAINGKRAPWESNPWVWVVEFKRVTAA